MVKKWYTQPLMKILIAQLNPIVGDLQGNVAKIVSSCEAARECGAQLVLFPELMLTGYPPEDLLLLPHFLKASEEAFQSLLPATKGITVIVGLPREHSLMGEKRLFNSAAILTNGELQGFYDKMCLPTYDVFDERRYFEPGSRMKVWEIGGKKVAVTICEDLWKHAGAVPQADYPIDPVLECKALKPDLLVNLSSSPYSVYKSSRRYQVCRAAAETLHVPIILCNQVGGNDSLIFDGASLYLASDGTLRAVAPSFVEDHLLVDISESVPEISLKEADEGNELYQALLLGIKDYFRKQGFKTACLGLSGGVDSAVVAALAVEALGKENVTALFMPSRYTGKESLTDAHQLIKNLGIASKDLSIEAPFETFLTLLTPHFTKKESDATEENLQARIRGMILMAFSNKEGHIVLSTGNKSELAMGYATLYGDMCGGLSVISDLTKRQVYQVARTINRSHEVIPQNILERAPTAELKFNQKDSDSLPDYEIVDTVLEDYIVSHHAPEVIAEEHGYPLAVVEDLICRIHRNEYKRRQGAPGLRVSEKAFSIGRRFPIVQKWVTK